MLSAVPSGAKLYPNTPIRSFDRHIIIGYSVVSAVLWHTIIFGRLPEYPGVRVLEGIDPAGLPAVDFALGAKPSSMGRLDGGGYEAPSGCIGGDADGDEARDRWRT